MLDQKYAENKELRNTIKKFEANKAQIYKLKQKANQKDALQSELEKVSEELENKETRN